MNSPWTFLWYKGQFFGAQFRVYRDQRLARELKSMDKSGPRKGMPRLTFYKVYRDTAQGYSYWKITVHGKHIRIASHRAVVDSFEHFGKDTSKLVAAHRPGKKRYEGALGDTELMTQKENCAHKRRDGTYSTGGDTVPGKLSGMDDLIKSKWAKYKSVSRLAKDFGVGRHAILQKLRKFGLKPPKLS